MISMDKLYYFYVYTMRVLEYSNKDATYRTVHAKLCPRVLANAVYQLPKWGGYVLSLKVRQGAFTADGLGLPFMFKNLV